MAYTLPTVSLKDIASELDVSISLVSKVLNNRLGNTRVSGELAEKIRKVAKERNYRKNSSALSLRSGFHNSLSVMIHRHGERGSPLVDYMVRGIFEKANDFGQKLMLGYFQEKSEFLEICESAHRGLVDGLIIGGVPHEELCDVIMELQKDGLPMVTILEEALHKDIPNVGINIAATGELPTRHLIEQGCKKIAHIAVLEGRLQGYRSALESAGIPFEDKWVYFTGDEDRFSYAGGEAAARHWIASGEIPDGVVAQSDTLATGLMNTFIRAGIKTPEDVMVTGVDDSPYCEYTLPSLSSVNQRNYPRGKKAVEMLMQLRKGKSVESLVFEPALKQRASTGGTASPDLSGDIPDA